MTRADEVEHTVRVEHRPLALEMCGELRLREQQVDRGKRVDHRVEVLSRPLDAARELVEDASHLSAFRELGLAQRVVRLEDLERLDEDGGPAGGLVVDDPLHRAAHL